MTDEENSVFLSKQRALTSLKGSSGRSGGEWKRSAGVLQQGIVCECCVHQCGYKELQQYCNPCVRRSSHGSHWPGHSLTSGSAERGKSGEMGFGSSSRLIEDVWGWEKGRSLSPHEPIVTLYWDHVVFGVGGYSRSTGDRLIENQSINQYEVGNNMYTKTNIVILYNIWLSDKFSVCIFDTFWIDAFWLEI